MALETGGIKPDDRSDEEVEYQRAQIEDILRRVDALPVRDNRTDDDILGYD